MEEIGVKLMKKSNFKENMIGAGSQELVNRYGSANAEFLKGLRGIDYESGIKFDRSLMDISNYKIDPNGIDKSIKQHAGFSAEVAHVSKKNAEAIIDKTGSTFSRSEDIARFGKNHNVVDIVEITASGEQITSQMKFVSDYESLLKKIAEGNGGGKNDLSRYMDVDRLDLPSEQAREAQEFCIKRANELRENAEEVAKAGKTDIARKLNQSADNYEELSKKINDSGISTEEAKQYRLNPKWETTKDIAEVSHRAGIEGAKFGTAIGGSISLISNIIAVKSGNKELEDALFDTATDTLKSAGVGYATGFTGSALKGAMQQSSKQFIREISKTGLPAMIVSTCLSLGKTVTSYASGEIDEKALFREIGSIANSSISTAAFSALGQIAIPIPVLGGLIGGMIGYTLTNSFYHSFLNALDEAKISEERYQFIAMRCRAAKAAMMEYQTYLDGLFQQKLIQLDRESQKLFSLLENPDISSDQFSQGINQFALMLGKKLEFDTQDEFDDFMLSDKHLIL